MLTTSTPETVNPVSDACEAAGVPCISTVVPWEAWYFGRGAKPGAPSPFKFTYHFCFGVAAVRQRLHHDVAAGTRQQEGRRDVAQRRRRQRDPRSARTAAQEGRLHDRRPGCLHATGPTTTPPRSREFKAKNCEIFNTFPIPPDFATFWQQAAQQGYKPKIAQIAKTGLFPSQVEALGPIGVGIAGGEYWGPDLALHLDADQHHLPATRRRLPILGRQAVEPAARPEPGPVRCRATPLFKASRQPEGQAGRRQDDGHTRR